MNGYYYPNALPEGVACGALRHEMVMAQVYKPAACSDHLIAIFVGNEIIHEAPLPWDVTHAGQVNPFVRSVVEAHDTRRAREAFRSAR